MVKLEFSLKDKNTTWNWDYTDLTLFKDESLLEDFKLPNFIKFIAIGYLRVHLRKYTTFMAFTKLTKSQIVKFLFISLEEGPRAWFFDLKDMIKNN